MKRQIRRGVYETNSSSCHSLTMCSEEEFNRWKDGELLFDTWEEVFVSANILTKDQKEEAAEDYELNKDEYAKDWNDLSDNAKEKYYTSYAKRRNLIKDHYNNYQEYMYEGYLESYEKHYTTSNGEKIVAFGQYGHD